MAWNPDQYDKFKDQRSKPAFDLMAMLTPVPGSRAIDLGCGTGELTLELPSRLGCASVVGLDASKEMLARARSAGGDVSFVEGDISTWSADGQYDIVFSNAALQWVRGHRELFGRMRRALRPGGQLAVQMPMNHDYPTHVLAAEMSAEPRWASLIGEPYDKFASLLSVEDYASLLFSLGFAEQDVVLRVYPQVVASREAVVEWVRGSMLTYFESRLSPQDYARFVDEFRTRLFERLPDDKPFFYPFKRVLMWGRLGLET